MASFLVEQYEYDGAVQGFSFKSPSIDNVIYDATGVDFESYFASACGFNQVPASIYSVQENYLQVVDLDYYMPTEVQDDIYVPELETGQPDMIYTLYTTDGLTEFDGNKDIDNVITSLSQFQEAQSERFFSTYTPNIKVVIPEGLRDVLSIDTNVTAKVCIGIDGDSSGSECPYPFIS
mmetsp:Transcript_3667/g.2739  ORF Transcript_3667/g.2739 Transcript_3667/m.2739 type:complete len:178 (+) Transcript_3667:647-1180(+)